MAVIEMFITLSHNSSVKPKQRTSSGKPSATRVFRSRPVYFLNQRVKARTIFAMSSGGARKSATKARMKRAITVTIARDELMINRKDLTVS